MFFLIVSRQSHTEPKIGILIWSFLLKKPPCVGDLHPRLITEGTSLGHPAVQVRLVGAMRKAAVAVVQRLTAKDKKQEMMKVWDHPIVSIIVCDIV